MPAGERRSGVRSGGDQEGGCRRCRRCREYRQQRRRGEGPVQPLGPGAPVLPHTRGPFYRMCNSPAHDATRLALVSAHTAPLLQKACRRLAAAKQPVSPKARAHTHDTFIVRAVPLSAGCAGRGARRHEVAGGAAGGQGRRGRRRGGRCGGPRRRRAGAGRAPSGTVKGFVCTLSRPAEACRRQLPLQLASPGSSACCCTMLHDSQGAGRAVTSRCESWCRILPCSVMTDDAVCCRLRRRMRR